MIFSRIGKVLHFDDASEKPGLRKVFGALVWIETKASLLPSVLKEIQEGRTVWVDIRYEGVFIFCKAGVSSIKSYSYSKSRKKVKNGVDIAIVEACKAEAPVMFGDPNAFLYTNKLMGFLFYLNS